jgi:hypothetical protein
MGGDLTKWPRLLVVGQPVTREQAAEILLRTDSWYLACNDRAWVRELAWHADLEVDEYGRLTYGSTVKIRERLRVLDLAYVGNDRLASAWIGGPHGWVDWNGAVGCTTWNIGKYPGLAAVQQDLEAIAAEWPFLDMQVQLIPDEGEGGPPYYTWTVSGGVVSPDSRVRKIASPGELSLASILSIGFQAEVTRREQGCTLDTFKWAMAYVETKMLEGRFDA